MLLFDLPAKLRNKKEKGVVISFETTPFCVNYAYKDMNLCVEKQLIFHFCDEVTAFSIPCSGYRDPCELLSDFVG